MYLILRFPTNYGSTYIMKSNSFLLKNFHVMNEEYIVDIMIRYDDVSIFLNLVIYFEHMLVLSIMHLITTYGLISKRCWVENVYIKWICNVR